MQQLTVGYPRVFIKELIPETKLGAGKTTLLVSAIFPRIVSLFGKLS
jgi:hypothetical protein